MPTTKTKTNCSYKKVGGNHKVTSDEVMEVVRFADNLPEVTTINLGWMRSGLKSVKLRIRVSLRDKTLRVMARGGPFVQEIWIYSRNLVKTMRQLERNFAP